MGPYAFDELSWRRAPRAASSLRRRRSSRPTGDTLVKPESPEERQAVEVASLEEVKRQAYANETLKRDLTIIHDIRLEDSYPDTRIVVDVQRFARRATLDWRLWPEG